MKDKEAGIHHAVVIGATARKVYDAVTTEAGLAGWWTPKVSTTGEIMTIARFPFGEHYFKEMKIVELVPFSFVKWHCVAGGEEWVGTKITFELISGDKTVLLNNYPEIGGQVEQQQNAEVTLLRFHHENWRAETLMFAECNYTWALFLKSLKLYCETGNGLPWPNQHRSHTR